MQSITITLPNKTWRGLKTKYRPEMLQVSPDEFLNGSQNFDTVVTGVITKSPGETQYDLVRVGAPMRDQFEAIFTDGTHQLLRVDSGTLRMSTGNGMWNTITTGYSTSGFFEFAMYNNLVYFDNGIDPMQVYDRTTTYGGVTYTAPRTKVAGAQAPITAPVATLNTDSTTNQVPAGGHTYKITFLYYGFEESNGSPSSNLVTNDATHTSNTISAIPIGGYGVTARNIYRDDGDGNYLLVGTIPNNTATTFVDTNPQGTSQIPLNNDVPPTGSLLVINLSRLWVAGVPGDLTTLYFSLPGSPDIFNPISGFLQCNPSDPITGLAVYNGRIVVFNRNSMGQVLGTTTSTFNYAPIPNSPGGVGCVDNRSIQIRTIGGVPTLIWLSDKGFYQYNGQSVDYLSDDIEDQVNFNLQQTTPTLGSNSQNTQSQFLAGTYTSGIDLTSDPGVITTVNPTVTFEQESDWTSGTLSNMSTEDGTNTLKVPVVFSPIAGTSGTLAGAALVSGVSGPGSITLPETQNWTGESHLSDPGRELTLIAGANQQWATPITIPSDGTITSLSFYITWASLDSNTRAYVWSDALGSPGGVVGSSAGTVLINSGFTPPATYAMSLPVTAGNYWIGFLASSDVNVYGYPTEVFTDSPSGYNAKVIGETGPWTNPPALQPSGDPFISMAAAYAFTESPPGASSGSWTSDPDDTFSLHIGSGMSLYALTTIPAGTSAVYQIQGSVLNTPYTWVTTDTVTNPNGATALTGGNYRYWQVIVIVSTTDTRYVPVASQPVLSFGSTGVWTSPAIETTTDTTSFLSLPLVDSVPGGTSVTALVATSPDNITYSSFVPFGSAVPSQWAKIMLTLTAVTTITTPYPSTPEGSTVTSSVSSVQLNWTVTSTFTSSVIDLGQVPSGWGLFLDSAMANGGSYQFYMRSASSSGAISSATFYPVSNGSFPPSGVAPLEFAQWKIVFVSTPNQFSQVTSVTINWYIGSNAQVARVASIFWNRTYYMAAQEYNQTHNNVIYVLDDTNSWKIYRGKNLSTMSYFFNQPYGGDAVLPQLNRLFTGLTDLGAPVTLDIRLDLKTGKRVENDMDDKVKIFQDVNCMVTGTGAVYSFYISTDQGNTWTQLVDPISGLSTFTTPNDGQRYVIRMAASQIYGQPTPAGRSMFVRVVENTAATAEIRSMKIHAWIREFQKVNYNNA